MNTPTTTTVSLAEFGRMVGRSRSSIHELVQRGKLTAINGRIHPALGLVEFEKVRPRASVDPAPSPPAVAPGSNVGAYGAARARRESALADLAELDLRRQLHKVLDAAEVADVIAHAGTVFRATLEGLPNRLAPRLAGAHSEEAIAAILSEQIEAALTRLSLELGRLADEASTTVRAPAVRAPPADDGADLPADDGADLSTD
jgi:hypothetical protein